MCERERTDFVMPDDDSAVLGPSWSVLLKKSIEEAASFVSPYTTSVKNAKELRITDYVKSRAPEYRAVVKHRKDLLDPIASDLPDEKLDVELYKADQIYDAELRQESSSILSSLAVVPLPQETRGGENVVRQFRDASLTPVSGGRACTSFVEGQVRNVVIGKPAIVCASGEDPSCGILLCWSLQAGLLDCSLRED
jgi:hypothetical protein